MNSKTTNESTTSTSSKAEAPTTPQPTTPGEPAKANDEKPAGSPKKVRATKASSPKKPAAPKTKGTTKKEPIPEGPITLQEMAQRYVRHMEAAGKSPTTVLSYAQDLLLAIDYFGVNEPAENLSGTRVQVFYGSDLVMKTKAGRAKAKPTVLKTRRVLRLALQWAADTGLIAKAPEIDRDAEKKVWS